MIRQCKSSNLEVIWEIVNDGSMPGYLQAMKTPYHLISGIPEREVVEVHGHYDADRG